MPHTQTDRSPVAAIDAELRRRAFALPGVANHASHRSLPGARGLWVAEGVALARGDVLGGSREFAHIHPDGSLHVWLPVARAKEVHATGWGELHPWVRQPGFWDGVVMVYTPHSTAELEVVLRIVADAYAFVTGRATTPRQVAPTGR